MSVDVDPVVLGRDSGAQVVLEDPEVSALHCELRAVSEGILVKDLGSTNGTYVGTLRVQEAAVTTTTEITIGSTKLILEPSAKRKVDVGFSDAFGPLVGTGDARFQPMCITLETFESAARQFLRSAPSLPG